MLTEVRKELTADENTELDTFIVEVVSKYVAAEHKFLELVFGKYQQEDFTLEQAKNYINYLGALRLHQLGLIEANEVPENKLTWIEDILYGQRHTNFFESRVADYSHTKLAGDVDYKGYMKLLKDKLFAEGLL